MIPESEKIRFWAEGHESYSKEFVHHCDLFLDGQVAACNDRDERLHKHWHARR